MSAARLFKQPGRSQYAARVIGGDTKRTATLLRHDLAPTLGPADVLTSTLALALAGALALAAVRTGPRSARPALGLVGWLVGVPALTALCVAAGVTVGAEVATPRSGFVAGHAIATVLVLLLGLGLGLGRTDTTRGTTAFCLAAAAVLKLVLFDLAALDGIWRVVAFLGGGLLLLVMSSTLTTRPPGRSA